MCYIHKDAFVCMRKVHPVCKRFSWDQVERHFFFFSGKRLGSSVTLELDVW